MTTKSNIPYFIILITTMVIGLHSKELYATNNLEGIQWQLIELDGAALAPLPGGRQPSIRFDADKKSASGYNGCNNYFGEYDLQGQSLKFGPIASTRRACPKADSAIELKFMTVLEKTNGWEIKDGTLTLFDGTKALARFIIDKSGDAAPNHDALTIGSTIYTKQNTGKAFAGSREHMR